VDTRTPAPPPSDYYRRLMADRLRRIVAAQVWTGALELDDAEAIVTDLLDTAGLLHLLDADPRHLVKFDADHWVLQHPLACRPNLFACPLNRVGFPGPPDVLGVYVVGLNDAGDELLLGGLVPDRAEQSGGAS